MSVVKVYDDEGRLIREGSPRLEETSRGFVVRYELIGIIAVMAIQTMGGVWWAATQQANMTNVRSQLVEIKEQLTAASADRYKGVDAMKDQVIVEKRFERNEARILKLEQYLSTVGD